MLGTLLAYYILKLTAFEGEFFFFFFLGVFQTYFIMLNFYIRVRYGF